VIFIHPIKENYMHITFKHLRLLLGAVVLFVVGVATGAAGVFAIYQHHIGKPQATQADIFSALGKIASAKISGVHCEVNGTTTLADGQTVNNDVTVGEFLARYVSWSMQRNVLDKLPTLECESDSQICRFNYSGGQGPESWSSHLEFKYDQKTKTILRDSLSCIDVP
jgi:hypothetical protein